MMSQATRAYGLMHRTSLVEGASPHTLIDLLYQSALSRIAVAQQNLQREEWGAFHQSIDKALSIVHELQGSLQSPDENELSARLFSLYGYVADRLLEANRERNPDELTNAANVLTTLMDAWAGIATTGQAK